MSWTKHKMNVKLAAQTFSNSVAVAIKYLQDEAQMEEFQGSEATCEFLKQMDVAFDILNSKNPFSKGNKAPVTLESLPSWVQKCEDISEYIFNLTSEQGTYLRRGQRKTALWGFKFSMTTPDLYLSQAFPLIIRTRGRTGEIPVGEINRPQTVNVVVIEQSPGSWSHMWSLSNVSGCGSTSLFGSPCLGWSLGTGKP